MVLRDPKRGIYKRLVIEQDRIRGAVLYGDMRDGGWYLDLMKERRDIHAFRDELLFGERARAQHDEAYAPRVPTAVSAAECWLG